MNQSAAFLSLSNITKTFPGVVALHGVSLELKKAEVHALLGENGAGKSTFVKILSGAHRLDGGNIFIDGNETTIVNPHHAHQLGIFAIYQEPNVVLQLSVWENMFLGRLLRKGAFIRKSKMLQLTKNIMEKMDYYIDPNKLVVDLSVSEKQMLEIMKALIYDVRVLILDEPTSSLQPKEVTKLFQIIHQLKEDGVCIVYISHRLEEIREICDRGTILRNGEYVCTLPISKATDLDTIIQHMVGYDIKEKFPKSIVEQGEKLLEVKNLSQGKNFSGINFTGHGGEIVSIFGLRGCGNTELLKALFGARKYDGGEVTVASSTKIDGRIARAMKNGMFYLPADRKKEGLVQSLSVKENITLGFLRHIVRLGFIRAAKENSLVNRFIQRLSIKASNSRVLVRTLSGGNQQKVIIAKAMCQNAKILIMCEPTSGIDVGAKVEIYRVMNELVKEGCLIVLISSELSEVLNMSDRILVMHNGKLKKEFRRTSYNKEEILRVAFGEIGTTARD
jgi:ribose transport system ATP-binding protein